MATCRWLSVSADLTAAAAWSNGAAPTNGDTVIFPAQATLAPSSNLTGLSAVTVALWYVEDGCSIDLGKSGLPIQVGATNFVHFGSGSFYLSNQATANTSKILFAPTSDTAMMQVQGNSALWIWCTNGYTEISTNYSTSLGVFVTPVHTTDRPSVRISAAASVAGVEMNGGSVVVDSASGLTSATVMGGTIQFLGVSGVALLLQMGGYVDYQSTATLSVAEIMRGTFDISQGSIQRTVTTAYVHPAATYKRDQSVSTVTNEYVFLKEVGLATQ